MPINKNHEFEELDGVKCAIVEKNVAPQRAEFLKKLLEFNGYTVVIVASPPPKVAAPPKPVVQPEIATTQSTNQPINELTLTPAPETFTIGVTDVTFNPINAIFGRLLRTPDKHVVTLAYWHQKEEVSNDEIPYFEN